MAERQGKKWYKRFWIWVLIIIMLGIAINSIGGDSDDKDTSDSKTTTHKSETKLKKNYKTGDTINYKGYKVKVSSVNYLDGDEFNEPKKGNKYVVIKVSIKNDSDDKQDYNPYDFKLSADGNATDLDEMSGNDTYDNDTLDSGTLNKGAKTTGYLIGQAKPSSKLQLQYQPSFFDDKTVDINLN